MRLLGYEGASRTRPVPYYGKIAVFAWFNAGVRIWDIRDPFAVHEVGYFVPPPNKNTVLSTITAMEQMSLQVINQSRL